MHKAHNATLHAIQSQIKEALNKSSTPFALRYGRGHSNTTRSKSYKKNCVNIDCGSLNTIVNIDVNTRSAHVEPRVTIEQLVDATLKFNLIPAVVPEFKGITVGGAILGAAAESGSFCHGTFNDICSEYEMLCGDGSLMNLSRASHSSLFFGLPGSYGSLGLLTLAHIDLVPAKSSVALTYFFFSDHKEMLAKIESFLETKEIDFLDALAFSEDRFVVIAGKMSDQKATSTFPRSGSWYFQHVYALQGPFFEEIIDLKNYLFRYDRGAFWMGSYLLKPKLLAQFVKEGICKMQANTASSFQAHDIEKFRSIFHPQPLRRALTSPWMHSQHLWSLLHKAEKWVQDHFIIQDFCIPKSNSSLFFDTLLEHLKVFPLWICPIKATQEPQIFAPHLGTETHVINFGVYGLPLPAASIEKLTRQLECQTKELQGRKVLYSRSYYSEEEFWEIYSQKNYQMLKTESNAHGRWREITDKVLSQ